jgi:hypothetical protein
MNSKQYFDTENEYYIFEKPVFFLLPPMGQRLRYKPSTLDRTLLQDIKIHILSAADEDNYKEIICLEANSPHQSKLRLFQNNYRSVCILPRQYMRKPLLFIIEVDGLKIATFNRVISAGRYPIRFRIHKHPRIRTRVMAAQGSTSSEIAYVLSTEFELDASSVAKFLLTEHFTPSHINTALSEVFNIAPPMLEKARSTAQIDPVNTEEPAPMASGVFETSTVEISPTEPVQEAIDPASFVKNLIKAGHSELQAHAAVLPLLIKKYAPIIYFHPDEQYFPSSVEWYLEHGYLQDDKGVRTKVTPSGIEYVMGTGIKNGASKFWFGPDNEIMQKGNLENAKTYVHIYHPPLIRDRFDIQFWFFYPFKGADRISASIGQIWNKTSVVVPFGEQFGYWEAVIIRFKSSTLAPIGVYLSQYGDYPFFTLNSKHLTHGRHLKVYSALNSHGNFLIAGSNLIPQTHLVVSPLGNYDIATCSLCSDGGKFLAADKYSIAAVDGVLEPGFEWLKLPYSYGPDAELKLSRHEAAELLSNYVWPPADFCEVLPSSSVPQTELSAEGLSQLINSILKAAPKAAKEKLVASCYSRISQSTLPPAIRTAEEDRQGEWTYKLHPKDSYGAV